MYDVYVNYKLSFGTKIDINGNVPRDTQSYR